MELVRQRETNAAAMEADFTQAVNTYLDDVYNYARYMVQDADEADDIAQKTFLSLYNNFSKIDRQRPLKPWLLKVARNHCLDFFKAKRMSVFSEFEHEIIDIPESVPSIESQLDSKDFLETVKDHIKALPLPAREILLLKYFEELTFEEIGTALSIPVNSVKTHFYRAKTKLFASISEINA
jgi:RNA polymerase sigma-70 factor, ECF subfamily